MVYEDFARAGSKTARRELRMSIRHSLGTSREDAPNVWGALRAVEALDKLLSYASGGRMCLLVSLPSGSSAPDSTVSPVEARRWIEELREQRESREGQ